MWLRTLAGVAAASVLALAIVAPLLAISVDHRERMRETAVVGAGLEQVRQDLLGRVGSDANWDPAMLNLENRFDEAWAQQTLTSRAGSDVTTRLVTVTGPDDRMIFIRAHSARVAAPLAAAAQQQLRPLVERIRALEVRRRSVNASSPGHSAADWISASDVVWLSGRPFLVVASLVGTDTGTVQLKHAHASILAYWSDLGTDILPELASRFLLQDASLDGTTAAPGRNVIALRSDTTTAVTTLQWTAEQPGRKLLLKAMLPLGLVVLVFATTVLFAYRHAVTGSRALKKSQAEAYHLAFHDGLTGLPNRRLFNDRVAQALARTDDEDVGIALLMLDLDRFKIVNDSYGHHSGDQLLQEVARRLLGVCRPEDTCARLGGDEFVILAVHTGASEAAVFAKRVSAVLAQPVELAGRLISCNASIGISIGWSKTCQPSDLLRQADLALYKAKEQARGSFRFFELEMDSALLDRAELVTDLMQELARGTLDIVYQPQFEGDRLIGVEALTRWNHPQRGQIPPSFFVPLAEEYGLMEKLSDFTLPRIFTDCRHWQNITVAVNLSASQLHLPNFLDKLDAMVALHGVDPTLIEIEITESVLMVDDGVLRQILSDIHARGFRLTLDDFGTGYSSLSYLSKFPIDRMKIDRTFISGLPSETCAISIVKAMIALADALGITIIAEGVETHEQKLKLADLGCPWVQGYLTGPPVCAGDIDLLRMQQVA